MTLTTKQALRLAAGLSIAQGVGLAIFLRRIEGAHDRAMAKTMYIASIVQRNVDRLDEFDKIALADMGMLKVAE